MDAEAKKGPTSPARSIFLALAAFLCLLFCAYFLTHGRSHDLPDRSTLQNDNNYCSRDDASSFDVSESGRIEGRVVWQGEVPQVKPLEVLPIRFGPGPVFPGKRVFLNPHAPVINPDGRGVGNAVVFLRGVDSARARPWDHPPVTAAFADDQLRVEQWPGRSDVGLVRRGESFTAVSRQRFLHFLKADGAAFFGLAFPDPDQPLSRRLEKAGVVELSSGAFCFWMRAHLFVDDHPYYCGTRTDGNFTLPDVPTGTYEIVCWMPDWHEDGRDRDPETNVYSRLFFRPPVELRQRVVVEKGGIATVHFTIRPELFGQ